MTVDEVEKIQRKQVATIIGHVFQLTYAAFCEVLVHQAKVNQCNGCAIHHPSQREHSCLMMESEEAWNCYNDEAREQIDLVTVMKTVEKVCSTLGFKLGQTWERYLTELPKFPWTSIYLTSLELEHCDENIENRVLYALYFGPNGLKCNDFSSFEDGSNSDEAAISVNPVECPETIIRKEEEKMDIDLVINEIQNRFCL